MMLFRNLLKGREEFGKRIQTSKSTFIMFLNTQRATGKIDYYDNKGKLYSIKINFLYNIQFIELNFMLTSPFHPGWRNVDNTKCQLRSIRANMQHLWYGNINMCGNRSQQASLFKLRGANIIQILAQIALHNIDT